MEPLKIKGQYSALLGKKIARIRLAAKLKQPEFAKALGTNKDQISRYERGINIPHIELLKKIAEFAGIPIGSLVDLKELQKEDVGEYKNTKASGEVVSDLLSEFAAEREEYREILKEAAAILEGDDEMVKEALISNIRTFFHRMKKANHHDGGKSD